MATTGAITPAKLDAASKAAVKKITEEYNDMSWGAAIELICKLHIKYIKEEIHKNEPGKHP